MAVRSDEHGTSERSMQPSTHERLSIEPLGPAHHAGFLSLATEGGLAEVLFEHPEPTGADVWTAIEIAEELRATGQGEVFVVFLGDAVIGVCRLDRHPDCPGAAEVGYGIGEPFRGRGLATAAVGLVVERAFAELGMERLSARCPREHLASRRVLEKLGFGATRETQGAVAPFIDFELRRAP